MKVHALRTGRIVVKEAFLHARPGPRGRLALLLPGPWADPLPIHQWLIEHDQHRILVDAGEMAAAKDLPFARHLVAPEDELPRALAGIWLEPADVTTTVVTHLHPDHIHGTVHLRGPVLVGATEWADAQTLPARIGQRLTGGTLPRSVEFRPVALDDGPFGAFAASRRLTDDGRVVAVATPGHTRGHLSVIAIDDDGRHLLLAGDATDTLEQLRARRADAVAPDPAVQRETIDRILAHAQRHPTVYLPSHDPDAAARLTERVSLD